jgi:phosphate/phosphite/phosphonate ABC transporter binding protein
MDTLLHALRNAVRLGRGPRYANPGLTSNAYRKRVLCAMLAGAAFAMFARASQAQEVSSMQAKTTIPVVSLPMYEVSDTMKKADDIFWSRLQDKLKSLGMDAPATLTRTEGALVDQWQGEQLLLSQTCGYPYVHILMQQGVRIVGTPVYTTNNELPPGVYRSVIIVRAGTPYRTLADLKGKKAGVNDMGSNSGMNLFRATLASSFPRQALEHGIFASVILTGGHLNSVRMVANGQIDVAAIDSVSYDLIRRDYPELAAKTRVLMVTPSAPGLPMITGARTDDATIEKIRIAIKELLTQPGDAQLRWALDEMKLKGFVVIDQQVYRQRIDELEDMARDKGYPILK